MFLAQQKLLKCDNSTMIAKSMYYQLFTDYCKVTKINKSRASGEQIEFSLAEFPLINIINKVPVNSDYVKYLSTSRRSRNTV